MKRKHESAVGILIVCEKEVAAVLHLALEKPMNFHNVILSLEPI